MKTSRPAATKAAVVPSSHQSPPAPSQVNARPSRSAAPQAVDGVGQDQVVSIRLRFYTRVVAAWMRARSGGYDLVARARHASGN